MISRLGQRNRIFAYLPFKVLLVSHEHIHVKRSRLTLCSYRYGMAIFSLDDSIKKHTNHVGNLTCSSVLFVSSFSNLGGFASTVSLCEEVILAVPFRGKKNIEPKQTTEKEPSAWVCRLTAYLSYCKKLFHSSLQTVSFIT